METVTVTTRSEREVTPKILKMHLKVSDMFTAELYDADDKLICEQDDGYVPDFMPGHHYGDYVILNIDVQTGKVTNWDEARLSKLQEWVDEKSSDDE